MDNATLSLLSDPIFWTFLIAGVLCLAGSALVSYPTKRKPPRPFSAEDAYARFAHVRRYRDEHEDAGV